MKPTELRFAKLAARAVDVLASPAATVAAVALVVGWAVVGPFVGYSELWQLAINTGTTVITFVMAFLILSNAKRDDEAVQAKLDEIIRALDKADNALIGAERPDVDTAEVAAQAAVKHAT